MLNPLGNYFLVARTALKGCIGKNMKSIMEEASSIFKAIENAWNRAGQPQDFSVKVFEEPQRNFFGMTIKSAKIGLFFDEKSPAKTTSAKATQAASSKQKAEPQPKVVQQNKSAPQKKEIPAQKATKTAPVKKEVVPAQTKPAAKEKITESGESIWTPEMVKAAEEWTKQSLSLMNMPHITFSTKLSKYYIHFTFDAKLFENNMKEKTLFRSFAYLIMASLRNKFKKEFRGLKVVLSS